MVIFVPGGLPASFAPVPANTIDGATGGTRVTVGALAAVAPKADDNLAHNATLTDRRGPWSAAGSQVVPHVSGGTFITTLPTDAGWRLGPGGRTRRYNVDPIPSTSGAAAAANNSKAGTPRPPSGPSVATQPWPRVVPVWPVRRSF